MTSESVLVDQEVQVDAPPETVYEFLTDPALIPRWMGRSAEIEPRPGGLYRIEINDQTVARGEFVELDPGVRVVFTFGWEGEDSPVGPGSTVVEITLTPESGGTRVRLVHRDLPAPAVDDHTKGWRLYLDRLAIAAAGGDPGPDPHPGPDQA